MEEKDKYLISEYLFTFLLLFSVVLLVGESLSGRYRLYSTFGLIFGFYFSWLNRNEQWPLIRRCINFGTLGVFIWLVYSLFHSSFLYKEVILIFIKGGIFLAIILSFNSHFPSTLNYIQTLSLPLFMCSPILIKNYNTIQAALVLVYLICWIIILKIKFYTFFRPKKTGKFIWPYSLFLNTAFLLLVTFASWMFSSYLRLGKMEKGGFFFQEGKGLQREKKDAEQEYYDLQDKIQAGLSELILEFKSTEEKQEVLYLLSSLLKELPDIMEAKKAEQGLIDILRRPGLGIEKGEAENLVILIKDYLHKKTALNIKIIKENIMDFLKKNHFSIQLRIAILYQVNRMQYSNSYGQINRYEGELQEIINKSSVDVKVKSDLQQMVRHFKEWKDYEIYLKEKEIRLKSKGISSLPAIVIEESQPAGIIEEEPKLVSIILSPQNAKVFMKESLYLKAEGHFTDFSHKDITSLVTWKVKNPRLIAIKEGKVQPLRFGNTQVHAEYSGIESLPVNIRVTFTMKWLISLMIIVISSLILSTFLILYFLTETEKYKLKRLLEKNPRKFIVSLYENAKKILTVFGLEYKEFMPPLSFALLVENRYSIEDNLFLRFTMKFEEAKYSQHILHFHNAFLSLSDYNNFLKILFSRYNKGIIFLKYCFVLLQRRPLFII